MARPIKGRGSRRLLSTVGLAESPARAPLPLFGLTWWLPVGTEEQCFRKNNLMSPGGMTIEQWSPHSLLKTLQCVPFLFSSWQNPALGNAVCKGSAGSDHLTPAHFCRSLPTSQLECELHDGALSVL